MMHEMRERNHSLSQAFVEALKQRGTASLFTAITMTVSVMTWAFSTLKFQADMGILLAFMFLVNVFGAILLLPALAAYVVGDRYRAGHGRGIKPPPARPARAAMSAGEPPCGANARSV